MSHFAQAEVQNQKKNTFKVSVPTATSLFILKAHLRFSRKWRVLPHSPTTSKFGANFRHSKTKKKMIVWPIFNI